MDAVLGLSVTPSAIGVVLVDGSADSEQPSTGDGFEVRTASRAAEPASARAAAALQRAEAAAASRGRRVRSVGVTWSDDADVEAALLLKTLSDSGFDNVVEVRLPEATDGLARGIAEMMGYPTTAVCLIEPGQLIALVVHTDSGAVQTAFNRAVVTEEDLTSWLGAVFAKADSAPEALVLVGSAEDLDGLAPVLQDALSLPVFAPAEAGLALARGAAVACLPVAELGWRPRGVSGESPPPGKARRFSMVAPAAMLAAGMVTFVASASAALALEFGPAGPSTNEAASSTDQTPAAFTRPAPASPPPGRVPVAETVLEPVTPAPELAIPVPELIEAAPIGEASEPLIEAEPVGLPALDQPAELTAPPIPEDSVLVPQPASAPPPQ